MLEGLLARDPGASALPADVAAGLREVSGYPVLTYRQGDITHPHKEFTGTGKTLSPGPREDEHILSEYYTVRQFDSAAAAKAWVDREKPAPDPKLKYHQESVDDFQWLRGDRCYSFMRIKRFVQPRGA